MRLRPAPLRTAAARVVLASVFGVLMAAHASALPATTGDPVSNDVPASVVLAPPKVVVIEEGRVYVHFGSYGTAALDTSTFSRARSVSSQR